MAEAHGMSRMQELLSSYYGMQDQESEQESQRNIDSQGFDSKVYVKIWVVLFNAQDLLQTCGLNDLLKKDDQLIREIKELDTNMQMLVYENYNKFISATDTIRKMKNNVASMEEEVGKVVASMDVITEKSESINVALAPHRSKVEKLIGVRRLLKRLEFIFDLPQRLNTAVKQEEYANATKYFLLARRILGRYEHIASFKSIQLEAEKIMHQLKQLLTQRLYDSTMTSEQICETVTLLNQLDACTDEMRQQFLDWHQAFFEKLLAKYKSNQRDESVVVSLERFNSDVLTKMANVFEVYKKNFLPDLMDREKKSSSRTSTALHDDAFIAFAKDLFGSYLSVCSSQLRRPHQDFGTVQEVDAIIEAGGPGSEAFLDASGADGEYFVLMCVLKQFISQVREVDAIIPPCRLVNGAIEIVETCVRFQIDSVFRKLRHGTIDLLTDVHHLVTQNQQLSRSSSQSNKTQQIQQAAQETARTFTDMMQQVLRQMEPLVQTGATVLQEMSRLFSELVQTQFYQFLKWFNNSLLMYTESKRSFAPLSIDERGTEEDRADQERELPWLEPIAPFYLYLACVCEQLASEGIRECLQVLIECLPMNNSPRGSLNGGHHSVSPSFHRSHGAHYASASGQVDVTHMIQVTRETSIKLSQHVAKMYGNQLCTIIKKGIDATSWADMDTEPRSVQEVMTAVIENTFRFGRELALALGEDQSTFLQQSNSRTSSRDFRRRPSGLRSRGGDGHTSGMQLDVERIFAKKIQVFTNMADMTTDWFVQCMLKMSIKALGEWVRNQEFSKFGLQQIQLNAEFLGSTTVHLVTDSQELESLLSDVLSNARERSTEDVLMDQSNVAAIVSTKSTQVMSRKGHF